MQPKQPENFMQVLALWISVALGYIVLAKCCLLLGTIGGIASPFWLPAGLVMGLPLLLGYRVLPGIFAGQFLTTFLFQSTPLWMPLMQGIGNVLEGAVFLFISSRYMRDANLLGSLRNFFVALPAAMFASSINAACGVGSLIMAGFIPPEAMASAALTWSSGDLGGALIVAPLIFAWKKQDWEAWRTQSKLEFALLALATAGLTYLIFFDVLTLPTQPLVYLLLPLLLYGAFRFAHLGATVLNCLLILLAIVGTTHGHGPFAASNPIISMILLQTFTSILIVTSLLVMIINSERLQVTETLKRAAQEMEQRVIERTASLEARNVELKNAQLSLQESAYKLNGLYELSPLGISLADMHGRFVEFNDAFQLICGYAADELKAIDYWALTPKEYEAQEKAQLESLAKTGRYGPYEKEYIRKDGTRVPLQLNGMLVRGQDGSDYIWSIVEDISARKKIDIMKNEFVSTVSHELRTPLTSIFGALGLVNSGALGIVTEKMRPVLDIAYRNSERLTQLINDLLDMEKIVAGKMHFDMQTQLLMPLVQQAMEACKHYSEKSQLRFVLVERADDVEVNVDGLRVIQILSNFLSNAAKFSLPGEAVEISVRKLGDQVRVEVVDHGPGIPAEFRKHIFKKFSQADSSDTRQKGGTGLGLSIAKELVERMGGQIGFESVEGHGAMFFVTLPILGNRNS